MEVHHCWHTQRSAFSHPSRCCQPPAGPLSAVVGTEGGQCPTPQTRSAAVYFWGRAALMWCLIKIHRRMCGGKWCPEEREPTESVLPSSADGDSVKICTLGNHSCLFFFSAHQYFMFPADQNEKAACELVMFLALFQAICQKLSVPKHGYYCVILIM